MIFDGTCERGGAQRAPQGIGVRRLGAYGAIATATTRRGEGEGSPCSMQYAGVCLSVILVTSDTSAAAMARKYERRFVVCGLCFCLLSFVLIAFALASGIRHRHPPEVEGVWSLEDLELDLVCFGQRAAAGSRTPGPFGGPPPGGGGWVFVGGGGRRTLGPLLPPPPPPPFVCLFVFVVPSGNIHGADAGLPL
jgi:hypothetical protein